MIKNVIFDVNNVLRVLNNEPLENYLPQSVKGRYTRDFKNIYSQDYFKKYFNNSIAYQHDLGLISEADLVSRLSERFGEPAEILKTMLEARCQKKHNTILKPVLKFAQKLKSKGYRIFILSNMGKDAATALTKMLGKKNFHDIVFSCDVHMCKPNREFYEYALDRFNIIPEETLFVDDLQTNLNTFESLGGYIYLFNTHNIEKSIKNIEYLLKQ